MGITDGGKDGLFATSNDTLKQVERQSSVFDS